MPDPKPLPPEPIAVLQTFIDASLRKDEPVMRACLNKKTLESGSFSGAGPEGVRFEMGEATWDGDVIVIPLAGYPLDMPADQKMPPVMTLPCVMILEDGAWKLDLAAAMERMFGGGGLEAVMNEAVGALGEAMKGMGEALGNAMGEAFGGATGSIFDEKPPTDWLHAPLDIAPEEFLLLPEMTALPKTAAAVSTALGSPVLVTAAVVDLLKQLGSNERDQLVTWFEDVLFAQFGDLFSRVKAMLPAPPLGRLHGIRMEAAKSIDDRCLILDGNDLIYRMYLNSNDGYYSDAGVLDLLPGLMAGLVEPSTADGQRTLPDDEEPANIDLFKEKTVPRFMRRISELLGKNIPLEANWDDLYDKRDTRQLYRWTLNRIFGALALACLNDDRRHQLSAQLQKIHLILGSTIGDRFAEYKDGTLTVSIYYYYGEKGSFYERDLERVLAGEAIRPPEPPPEEPATEETSDENKTEEDDSPTANAPTEEEPAAEEPEPPATDEALNDELFKSAAESLKQNESIWASSLEMCFQHPVTLHLNFDSLAGRYALIQPFIHQGLTGAVEALSKLAFDPNFKPKVAAIQTVTISALDPEKSTITELNDGQLSIRIPIKLGDFRAPTNEITAALLAMPQ